MIRSLSHFIHCIEAGAHMNAFAKDVAIFDIQTRLLTGEILARGMPKEASPHDTKPINLQPAQWQYLLFSVDGRALDSKGETVYKALEIGRSR